MLPDGKIWVDVIAEVIANCDCFLPIITQNYESSASVFKEFHFALHLSSERAKKIVAVRCSTMLSEKMKHLIAPYPNLVYFGEKSFPLIIEKLEHVMSYDLSTDTLYEKLTEYKNIRNENKVSLTLCELIDRVCQQWEKNWVQKNTCLELLRLVEELAKYAGDYTEESKKTAHVILATLEKIKALLTAPESHVFTTQLFFASVAVRLTHYSHVIHMECTDILSNGEGSATRTIAQFMEYQKPFVQAWQHLFRKEAEDRTNIFFGNPNYTFITETEQYILAVLPTARETSAPKRKEQPADLSETDEILVSVAKFMQEGNKLFDVLQKNGMAGDFLGCLLTSYERLKNYCEVVGARNVAADCVDRIVEIRNAIDKATTDVSADEKVENGIKSLLGFTLRGSGNYDVFISFKNEDADLAEKVYNLCQRHLKVPFWSKRTLPQLSKSEYEDAIYDALRNSKHFVVVLSNLEYLKANWIKREMSAFDRAITEGRKTNANFVFVVTDNVYKEIIDSNKMCLDERYCGYQIIKMSEYEETLMQYIT